MFCLDRMLWVAQKTRDWEAMSVVPMDSKCGCQRQAQALPLLLWAGATSLESAPSLGHLTVNLAWVSGILDLVEGLGLALSRVKTQGGTVTLDGFAGTSARPVGDQRVPRGLLSCVASLWPGASIGASYMARYSVWPVPGQRPPSYLCLCMQSQLVNLRRPMVPGSLCS